MAWTDQSGMFEDFNFKLVVINDILDKNPSFSDELAGMKARWFPTFTYYQGDDCIPEMTAWFEQLRLTAEDLRKVETLWFDGGSDVYFLLKPDWDGELDIFDVASVAGFERLENLARVEWTGMCGPSVLRPLRDAGIPVIGC